VKSPLLFSPLILAAVASACAQTYTYKTVQQANLKTGQPISAIAISGNIGYGSDLDASGTIYRATPSMGVHPKTNCCQSNAALISDSRGNLYGQDHMGANLRGRIFMVSATTWKETDLYAFTGGEDGWVVEGEFYPTGAPIVESPVTMDPSGNLWGVTYLGGPYPNCVYGSNNAATCGVVFELTPNGDGTWSETVIHAFSGTPDGGEPEGALAYDATTDSFYGTTQQGGNTACNCGTVYQLSPNGDGTWSESIVYTFLSPGEPTGGVTIDAQDNLYGVNFATEGYVYEISGGQFSVIASLFEPIGLVMDSAGNLLGTSHGGGQYNRGTIFELSPSQNGWQETIIHSFSGVQPDGELPNTGLAMDPGGNLWGVTPRGGANGKGLFFEVVKQ